MGRRIGFALGALVLGLLAGAIVAEVAARLYVYGVAHQGKLFEPDRTLGWRTLPDLDMTRRNANDRFWQVRTDSQGDRIPAEGELPAARGWSEECETRILILGDSFAFGEGVNLEDRFDSQLGRMHADWCLRNLGVMGYGTDQQLIAARNAIPELVAGDTILLLTHANDLIDVLRSSHSGRARAHFQLVDGELREISPEIGVTEILRDRSYLLARLFRWIDSRRVMLDERSAALAGHLYRRIVLDETQVALDRGVRLLVAHHGVPILAFEQRRPFAQALLNSLKRICAEPGVWCEALDADLVRARGSELFLSDGHWSSTGHAVVAEALVQVLERATSD